MDSNDYYYYRFSKVRHATATPGPHKHNILCVFSKTSHGIASDCSDAQGPGGSSATEASLGDLSSIAKTAQEIATKVPTLALRNTKELDL